MTNLESIWKSRVITLPAKVHVKAIVFPVLMYRSESWTIKSAECQRIDAFELWCWRRLLSVPWTARRPKQSTVKETNPEDSLERLIPKLHYSGLLCKESTHWKDWCLERFRAEGEEGSRGWVGWMASSAQWAWVWANSLKIVKDREAWHAAVHGVEKSQTRLSNWTTIRKYLFLCFSSQKFISM